jgi:hypothetical protein
MPELVGDNNPPEPPTVQTPTLIPPNINAEKLSRELRKLEGFFNPEANQLIKDIQEIQDSHNEDWMIKDNIEDKDDEQQSNNTDSNEDPQDNQSKSIEAIDKILYMVTKIPSQYMYNVSTIKKLQYHEINPSQLKDHIKIPFTFEQAWNNDDPWCRNKWREAINIKLKKMEDLKV